MEFRFLRFSLLPDTGQALVLNTAVPVLRPCAHHGAWPWVRSPSSSAESGSWVVSKASRLPWPLRTVQGMGSGALSPVLGTSLLLQACFAAVDSETRTEQWVSCCLEKTQCIWYFTILPNISRLKNQVLLILLLSLEQIYHLRETQVESQPTASPLSLCRNWKKSSQTLTHSQETQFLRIKSLTNRPYTMPFIWKIKNSINATVKTSYIHQKDEINFEIKIS